MNKSLHVDVGRSVLAFSDFRRQVPFAIASGLNDMAKGFQAAQIRGMHDRFIIRRPSYVKQVVKITHFARKTESQMFSEVSLKPPGKTRTRTVFDKFEDGGFKIARSRQNPVAIPSEELRPSRNQLVPQSMYPKNLRLVPRIDISGGIMAATKHTTRRGVEQLKGKRGTFVLDPAIHRGVKTWGVYQRETQSDIRLIWVFKTKIPIPASLRFYPTAFDTAERMWPSTFKAALHRAIVTSRR